MIDFAPLRDLTLERASSAGIFESFSAIRQSKCEAVRQGIDIHAFFERAIISLGVVGDSHFQVELPARTADTPVPSTQVSASSEPVVVVSHESYAQPTTKVNTGPARSIKKSAIDPASLRSGSGSVSLVVPKRSTPLPSEVPELLAPQVKELIGKNGVSRIQSFAALKPGWDQGRGQRLSPDSLRHFNGFFGFGNLRPKGLSVFLSVDGNLIGNWLDDEGNVIELEFSGGEFSYFVEASGEESVAKYSVAGDFKRNFTSSSASL